MTTRNLIAEIPLGELGLWGTSNLSQFPLGSLVRAENITYESGTVRKAPGSKKVNGAVISGTPTVISGIEYRPDPGTAKTVIATSGGKLYKSDNSDNFTIGLKTGLSSDNFVDFVQAGGESATQSKKLFCFSGGSPVQVLSGDGTSTTDIASPPVDWAGANQPSFGVLHDDRLFGGGNENDPHRLYYSSVTDHEDFLSGGTIAIFPGDGGKLIRAFSFNNSIVCFKHPRGVYIVDTTSPTIADWRVYKLNDQLGLAGPKASILVNDDLLYVTTGGELRTLRTTDTFSNFGSDSLTETSQLREFIRDNINFQSMNDWVLGYNVESKEVYWFHASSSSGSNDAALVMDITRAPFRFYTMDRDNVHSAWPNDRKARTRMFVGEDDGFVRVMDTEARNKDGNAYRGLLQTPLYDLSNVNQALATRRKSGKFLELEVDSKGVWDIQARILWDGLFTDTVTFTAGSSSSALGSIVIGESFLGGQQLMNVKRRITGGGRRFGVQFYNENVDQDFSISRVFIHFTVEDERII